MSHLAAVKRILRYVKGLIDCIFLFPAIDTCRKFILLDFTDSNWYGDKDDQNSIVGDVFIFDGTPIS